MSRARKTFAIILLVLIVPMWLWQGGVRSQINFNKLCDFDEIAQLKLDKQLFAFDEVYNAGRLLSGIEIVAKFFEALLLPLGVITAIMIKRNPTKKKIALIPACALLLIALFDVFCIIVSRYVNNIEVIDIVASLLRYENVDINLTNPVLNPRPAKINSVLLSIPAIGFLTCEILDIIRSKKNPENTPIDPKIKKAHIFYLMSAISIVALMLVLSFDSAGSKMASITWMFRNFFLESMLFIIPAIVFYVIGSSMDPLKEAKKAKKAKSVPSQAPVHETSAADELKKYKELLDSGAITQEEFDEKKKQLLGL